MSRAKWCGDEIYAEADRFRASCLLRDGSMLVPARTDLWTAGRLRGLQNLISPVQGGSFLDNLQNQLEGRPDEDRLLVADALYVLLLFGLDTAAHTRIAHLERILSELSDSVALLKPMRSALHAGGVANFSAGNAWRHAYLQFILRFAQRLKEQPSDQREATLADPWKCHAHSHDVRTSTDAMVANCLLHVLFPETFEYMVAETHRAQLLDAFHAAPGAADAQNTDVRIQQIRELAQAGQDDPVGLYEPPFVDIWKHQAPMAWAETIRLGTKLYEDPRFDTLERASKLEVAGALSDARRALLDGHDDWTVKLKRGIQHSKNNLTSWRSNPTVVKWFADNAVEGRALLGALWADDEHSVEDRMLAFLKRSASTRHVRRQHPTGHGVFAAVGHRSVLAASLQAHHRHPVPRCLGTRPRTRCRRRRRIDHPPRADRSSPRRGGKARPGCSAQRVCPRRTRTRARMAPHVRAGLGCD